MVAQKRLNDAVFTLVDAEGAEWVERLRPSEQEAPAPVGPMGTRQLEAGHTTVVEAPAATLGLEVSTPVVVDAGWLSRQLWRTVLGR